MPKYTFKLSVVVLFHLDYFQKTFYNIEPCSNPPNASSIITQIFGGYFLPYPSFRRLLIRFFSVIFRFLEDTLGCGNRFFRFAFVANDLGKDVGHGLGRLVTFRVALDVAASDTSHQTVQSRQDVLARTLLSRHGLRRHRSAERGSRFTWQLRTALYSIDFTIRTSDKQTNDYFQLNPVVVDVDVTPERWRDKKSF